VVPDGPNGVRSPLKLGLVPGEDLLMVVGKADQKWLPQNMGPTSLFAVGDLPPYPVITYNVTALSTWGEKLTAVRAVQMRFLLEQAKASKAKDEQGALDPMQSPHYRALTLALLRTVGGKAFDSEAKRLKGVGGQYVSPALDKSLGVKNPAQRGYVQHWLIEAAKS
jgi:hypothetical protein